MRKWKRKMSDMSDLPCIQKNNVFLWCLEWREEKSDKFIEVYEFSQVCTVTLSKLEQEFRVWDTFVQKYQSGRTIVVMWFKRICLIHSKSVFMIVSRGFLDTWAKQVSDALEKLTSASLKKILDTLYPDGQSQIPIFLRNVL